MQLDWWWSAALTIVVSIATVFATQGLQSLLRKRREQKDRKRFLSEFAFRLDLRYGNIWYIEKLDVPVAAGFRYHVVDRRLGQRIPLTEPIELAPPTRYGIRGIEIRDTIEVYWTESGVQHSTSVVIHDERETYFLKRENTGH